LALKVGASTLRNSFARSEVDRAFVYRTVEVGMAKTKTITGSFGYIAKRAASERLTIQWVAKDREVLSFRPVDVLCKQIDRDLCEIVPRSLAGTLFLSLLTVGV
jgi:hypothetical protein